MKYCIAILLLALFAIAMAQEAPQSKKEAAPEKESTDRSKRTLVYGGYGYHGGYHGGYPYGYHAYPYRYHGYPYNYHGYHGYHGYPYRYPYYGVYGNVY